MLFKDKESKINIDGNEPYLMVAMQGDECGFFAKFGTSKELLALVAAFLCGIMRNMRDFGVSNDNIKRFLHDAVDECAVKYADVSTSYKTISEESRENAN